MFKSFSNFFVVCICILNGFFFHLQADVNSDNVDDEDEDDTNNSPKETDRLYPTAPLESDDTASVHSTSV